MELTVLAVSSVFLVGVGYAVVQKAHQSPLVVWSLVCASLFLLSTRDLFQSRERGLPEPTDDAPDRRAAPRTPPARADGGSASEASGASPEARSDGGEDPSR